MSIHPSVHPPEPSWRWWLLEGAKQDSCFCCSRPRRFSLALVRIRGLLFIRRSVGPFDAIRGSILLQRGGNRRPGSRPTMEGSNQTEKESQRTTKGKERERERELEACFACLSSVPCSDIKIPSSVGRSVGRPEERRSSRLPPILLTSPAGRCFFLQPSEFGASGYIPNIGRRLKTRSFFGSGSGDPLGATKPIWSCSCGASGGFSSVHAESRHRAEHRW